MGFVWGLAAGAVQSVSMSLGSGSGLTCVEVHRLGAYTRRPRIWNLPMHTLSWGPQLGEVQSWATDLRFGNGRSRSTDVGSSNALTCTLAWGPAASWSTIWGHGFAIWQCTHLDGAAMHSLAWGLGACGLQSRATHLGSGNVLTCMGTYSLGAYIP